MSVSSVIRKSTFISKKTVQAQKITSSKRSLDYLESRARQLRLLTLNLFSNLNFCKSAIPKTGQAGGTDAN